MSIMRRLKWEEEEYLSIRRMSKRENNEMSKIKIWEETISSTCIHSWTAYLMIPERKHEYDSIKRHEKKRSLYEPSSHMSVKKLYFM